MVFLFFSLSFRPPQSLATMEKHTETETESVSAVTVNQIEDNDQTLPPTNQDIKSLKEAPTSIVVNNLEPVDAGTVGKKQQPWWRFWKKSSSSDELPDPRQFSTARKYSILLIVALAGASYVYI